MTTKKILEMNSKSASPGAIATFLKGAGAPAASVVAAESTVAQHLSVPPRPPPRGLVVDMFKWLCQKGGLETGESIC
jgi:hypothetical protein